MRTFTIRVMSLLAAIVMVTVLSTGVARACSDLVIGFGWSCELTGEDSQYCYYDCECSVDMVTCANRLGLAGFELI